MYVWPLSCTFDSFVRMATENLYQTNNGLHLGRLWLNARVSDLLLKGAQLKTLEDVITKCFWRVHYNCGDLVNTCSYKDTKLFQRKRTLKLLIFQKGRNSSEVTETEVWLFVESFIHQKYDFLRWLNKNTKCINSQILEFLVETVSTCN